jgi:hypothetical protein
VVTANFNPVNDIILAIVFIGGVIVFSRTRIPRQTIKDLQDHVAAQDLIINDLKEARIEDAKTIGVLQGQIQSYRDLPFESFKDLAVGIREVVKISKDNAASNQKILEVLTSSANIAAASANDGGLLVKTKANTPVTVKMEGKK